MKIKSGTNWTELANDSGTIIVLYSYFVPVATIVNGSVEAKINGIYSKTTNKHIVAFFKRHMGNLEINPVEVTQQEINELIESITLDSITMINLCNSALKTLSVARFDQVNDSRIAYQFSKEINQIQLLIGQTKNKLI